MFRQPGCSFRNAIWNNDLRQMGRGCNSRRLHPDLGDSSDASISLRPRAFGLRHRCGPLTRTELSPSPRTRRQPQADLGTNWEQDWRYQPNATTMSLGQCGIVTALKTGFKYRCNVFPIPRVWQTYRTQNPVLVRGCGFKSHLRYSVAAARAMQLRESFRAGRRPAITAAQLFSDSARGATPRAMSANRAAPAETRALSVVSGGRQGATGA